MTHYLLFDSQCLSCSSLAQAIESESQGWLAARSLHEAEMQALLNRARPGWKWEPTLLEVDGERVRVFTGLALRRKMLLGLGPKRAWRVAQLITQTGQLHSAEEAHHGRRSLLKLGGALTGAVALGLGWGLPDLSAYAATIPAGHRQTIHTVLHPNDPAIAALKATRVVRRATRQFGSPQWNQVYQLTHSTGGNVGYLILHQTSEQETRFLLVKNLDNPKQTQGVVGRIIPTGGNTRDIHWHMPNGLHVATTTVEEKTASTQLHLSAPAAMGPHRRRVVAKDATVDSAASCFVGCLIAYGDEVGILCEADCAACVAAPETIALCVICAVCAGGVIFECWAYCQSQNGGVNYVNGITYSYISGSSSASWPRRV